MKTLIIAEKREVGAQIASCLEDSVFGSSLARLVELSKKGFLEGDKYVIAWAAGHLFGLKKPSELKPAWGLWNRLDSLEAYQMPDMINKLELTASSEDFKVKLIGNLKEALRRFDINCVIIATDADAEGEAIGRNIISQLHPKINVPLKRLWITGSFKIASSVQKAMLNIEPLNSPKFEAFYNEQKARQTCDYLVGAKLTKALCDLYDDKFYIGRVKSVIVSLIGNRETEIKNFTAKPIYQIKAKLGALELENFYYLTLPINMSKRQAFGDIDLMQPHKVNYYQDIEEPNENDEFETNKAKQRYYFNSPDALAVLESVNSANLTGVIEINDKEVTSSKTRPLPLSGSDFASEMMGKYKISYEHCNQILDFLRNEGYASYPGTNGRYFGSEDISEVKTAFEILKIYFNEEVSEAIFSPRAHIFNDKLAAKQNHAPLHIVGMPDAHIIELWKRESISHLQEGFELIAKRLMVHFMPDDEIQKQYLQVDVNGAKFDLNGQIPIKQGWREFIAQTLKSTGFTSDFKVGDSVKLNSCDIIESATRRPFKYTTKTLLDTLLNVSKVIDDEIVETKDPYRIKELKETKKALKNAEGIGTDRTRLSIIKELFEANKITANKKDELSLTPFGEELFHLIPKSLRSVVLTGSWEVSLSKIEVGELDYKSFINEVDKTIMEDFIPDVYNNVGKCGVEVRLHKTYELKATGIKCPLCDALIVESDKVFKCQNDCSFVIAKNQEKALGRFVVLEDLKKILGSSRENPFEGKIYFNPDGKYNIGYAQTPQSKTNLDCPFCNSKIINDGSYFKCENDGCEFKVYKNATKITDLLGSIIDEEALGGILKSSKDNAYMDRVYLDATNKKYPISSLYYATEKTWHKGDDYIYRSYKGKELSLNEAIELLCGKVVAITLKSKDGKQSFKEKIKRLAAGFEKVG